MRIKNVLAAVCVILSFVLLVGCAAQKPDDDTERPKESSLDSREDIKENDAAGESEPAELTYLRAKIKENDSVVGVAYIDFVPDAENVRDYNYASDFSTNNIFNVYPFFYEYPVSVNMGAEMFAVVPSNPQSCVRVYKVNVNEDGELSVDRDTVLYENESGKPFILICNDNEAYSNVIITVSDGEKSVEFSPSLSRENGRDLVLAESCYDFTVNDIRAYSDEAHSFIIENIDEIRDGIEAGMTLRHCEDVFMYNHFVLKFQLGMYDEDNKFNVVREYLVDKYYTLAFYELEDDEQTIGWRVVGQGFRYD